MTAYQVRFTPSARHALTNGLPEKVAAAAFQFINGALADNPRRVGKPLSGPLQTLHSARRGEYRVIYRITEDPAIVEIVSVVHRRDAYRSR